MSTPFPKYRESTGQGRHFDQPGVWLPRLTGGRNIALWWRVLACEGGTRKAGNGDPGVNIDMFGCVGEAFGPCSQDLHWLF